MVSEPKSNSKEIIFRVIVFTKICPPPRRFRRRGGLENVPGERFPSSSPLKTRISSGTPSISRSGLSGERTEPFSIVSNAISWSFSQDVDSWSIAMLVLLAIPSGPLSEGKYKKKLHRHRSRSETK